jgi:hypothetical protein
VKRLLVGLVSLCLLSSAYAGEFAKLHMKISGPITNNRYFLCVSGIGCVSILNGNKGHDYPLDPGEITKIFTVDAGNMSMHQQDLPASCNVSVTSDQTLVVTGKLVPSSDGHVVINNLHCSVASQQASPHTEVTLS